MAEMDHVEDLLPAYALDSLDEDEAVLVSNHLATCDHCLAELRACQEVTNRLVLAVPLSSPPRRLKARLRGRIQAPQQKLRARRSRGLISRLLPVWGLASFVLIVILGAGNLLLWQRLARLESANQGREMIALPVTGTDSAPGSSGYILISADGQNGALVVDQLPLLDEDHAYQLWLIRDGQRTSGGIFKVDQGGYGWTRIRAPGSLFEYAAVGVTVEPAGGSPGPTGEKVLDGLLLAP